MAQNTAHIKKALQAALFDKIEAPMALLMKVISSIEGFNLKERGRLVGDGFEIGSLGI